MTDENSITLPIGYVAIPVEEYVGLIECNERYDTLLSALYDAASLSWRKNSLSFDSEKINPVLRGINPRSYNYCLKELKKLDCEAELKEVNEAAEE